MKIVYVTSNQKKFAEAQHVLQDAHFAICHMHLHLDEIQAPCDDIIVHKAKQAFSVLQKPVIVDDISVHFNALNGFPGPYIKHFLYALSEEGVYKLISKYDDREATAVCFIAFFDGIQEPKIFQASLTGTVVAPQGNKTLHGAVSWNRIIQPVGHTTTLASMSLEEVASISPRGHALLQLKTYLHHHYFPNSEEKKHS